MKLGNFKVKKKSKFDFANLVGYATLAAIGYIVISSLPDLKRYIKISTM